MSSHYSLARIDHQTVKAIQSSKSQEYLFNNKDYNSHVELISIQGTLEIDELIPFSKPFYPDKRQVFSDDGLPILLPKEGLDKLIKLMSLEVEAGFDSMYDNLKEFYKRAGGGLKEEDFDLLLPVVSHIHSRRLDWASVNDSMPYNTKRGGLVRASAWEYQLAQIVLIRKTFDFGREYLVLYKW